jgi:hypothetical protein
MKLNQKFSKIRMSAHAWQVYDHCSVVLGEVLDDKFAGRSSGDFHEHVYEHERESFERMYQPASVDAKPVDIADVTMGSLALDEHELLSILSSREEQRRLMVIADVGCGKSTFLRHMMTVHFPTPKFGAIVPIYLDWRNFDAPMDNPLPEIRQRFASDVNAVLEKGHSPNELRELDRAIFKTEEVFSIWRAPLLHVPEAEYEIELSRSIAKAWRENPVDFVFERLNNLCSRNRNAYVLIIDNIDQLQPPVLAELTQFLIRVQTRSIPLVIVALRDHTYGSQSVSAYRRSGTTTCWQLTLRAPNMRNLLGRRLDYFFPEQSSTNAFLSLDGAAAHLQLDEAATKGVLRRILQAPFREATTYEFLTRWSNYSVRQLFVLLQVLLSAGSNAGYQTRFLLGTGDPVGFTIDDCIVAFGLTRHRLYYPSASTLVNPYSVGLDAAPTDKLVGVRILQYLGHAPQPIALEKLRALFLGFGYSPAAIDAQLGEMCNKDVVWTGVGDPALIKPSTLLKLSYRGEVYLHQLLERSLFNYLMCFDTQVPSETHPVGRHHKSEFDTELDNLRFFGQSIDGEALASRLIGLADLIFEAEKEELKQLHAANAVLEFESQVGRDSAALRVVNGLGRLFRSLLESKTGSSRVTLPRDGTLLEVAERQAAFSKGVQR